MVLATPENNPPNFTEIGQIISAEPADVSTLFKLVNREKVSEIYGITQTEFTDCGDEKKAFILSVLTRMSASLLIR